MPRTPTAFSDDELHAICLALQQLDTRHADNRAFLRRAFDAIDHIAGRAFGETVYRRLLAVAGIARAPSTRTVQAVLAARRAEREHGGTAPEVAPADSVRALVQRELRVALQQLSPVPSSAPPVPAVPRAEAEADAAWLARHCERLEAEQPQLRAQLQAAEARAAAADARAQALAAQLEHAQAAAPAREREVAAQLTRASAELIALAARLEGAERRRAVETDAVRQAFREERAQLVARVERLEKDLVVARQALEVYRRRAAGGPA
ncbi:cell envelope biogenesis protein TolA [Ralstonia pseudosolanacearum]